MLLVDARKTIKQQWPILHSQAPHMTKAISSLGRQEKEKDLLIIVVFLVDTVCKKSNGKSHLSLV